MPNSLLVIVFYLPYSYGYLSIIVCPGPVPTLHSRSLFYCLRFDVVIAGTL